MSPGGRPPPAGGDVAGPRDASGRLPDRLRHHLERSALIRPGARVTVAASGGLDSTVLLHLLRFSLRDLALRVEAAHLDHAMRAGSGADAAWVRGLCRAWGVPCRVGRLDPPARTEADARHRRYAFLEEVAPANTVIATAHHLDDQAETVLFRAIRGTGVRGLRGIAPRRGRIVRPLLPYTRAEIEDYARAAGIAWRGDPTNRDVSLARNRIRHRVLPELEAARPGASRALARLAVRAQVAETAWEAALGRAERDAVLDRDDAGVTLARPVLHSYHPALRARLLRRVLRRYGSTPDRAGTHAALEFISSGPSGGELHVRGGVRLERDFDRIRIRCRTREESADTPLVIEDAGPGSGRAVIGGREVRVAWRPAPEPDDSAGAGSRDRIRLGRPEYPLVVRSRSPGDRIRLDYGSKKLKKLLAEHRLGRGERSRTPVVVDGAGRVQWVVGVTRARGAVGDGPGIEITVEHGGG
jgi:tRNA(Ile)-lysidine synthase